MLRERAVDARRRALTEFDRLLRAFRNWSLLDASEFEFAVSRFMAKRASEIREVTLASRDGGVDIEATDPQGRPTLIQAKRYQGRVGVSVIREMIGVREVRSVQHRMIVFSLVGFTSGARSLATEQGIELMDARSEVLQLD